MVGWCLGEGWNWVRRWSMLLSENWRRRCVCAVIPQVRQGVVTSMLPIDVLASGIKKFDHQNFT